MPSGGEKMTSVMVVRRISSKVSRKAVARACGISQQHYREIEELRRRPSNALGARLQEIFNQPLATLLAPVRNVGALVEETNDEVD